MVAEPPEERGHGTGGPGRRGAPGGRRAARELLPASWQPLLAQPPLAGMLTQPLVADALLEMRRILPPSLALHSLRAFLLADARARAAGTGYDRTGLFAAAAFHDTGLTGHAPRTPGGFPHRSAELLDRFLTRHGTDEARRRVLHRAVGAHMRPFPARDASPEARLLHFGAWLDVTGRGTRQVPGERRRLARLAPTPLLAVSFSARMAVCELRRALPVPSPPGR
ncbi:MAG TPA: hypothetical protein VFP69_17445 [Streptomyces sp.]|nr:hypothetical protein [Streptomyces sp.]